jgi:RNA polymerase sigma-70 factor (ECF subfamily)
VDDEELLRRFLAGDREAFRGLVERYQSTLVQIARRYVSSPALAEDVAQDTWLAVLRGASRFEGRSSFKTWLFHIVANRARTTGVRERRQIPIDPTDPVAANRFDSGGMWKVPPPSFADLLADAQDRARAVETLRAAIADLPEAPRSVVTLRDVEGLSTREVAELLGMSEANVRVVLHRARTQLRDQLERVVKGSG